ncbi:hypothetical protein TNCV_1095391 [Trichonephila clavipes]|nr:hypothetical protein TNCV_1095391 [Trichonephila clavipes]
MPWVVDSLVVRASDSRPDGLGSMCDAYKYTRVHTKRVLVKSVGPKVLWTVAAETTSAGDWRIFPSPPFPCLNCGDRDQWCRHLS